MDGSSSFCPWNISIHAPVKGATIVLVGDDPVVAISIHAPVKGATTVDMTSPTINANFNPRSREGSDTYGGQPFIWLSLFQSTLP